MLGAFFAGIFVIGGQVSLNALASFIYPTHIRSTGVGWALGIGRIGSIAGPILAGYLIGLEWGLASYFSVFGSMLFITALSIALIRHQQPPISTYPQ
jgi:AAHS family 4-hydroxybenzoate transporter-like MFS transporter